MNKRKVDRMIGEAYKVLNDVGIVKCDKINKAWRGQISSFGASIAQGSLLGAVSFFSAQGGAEVDRSKLMSAIARLLEVDKPLYEYISTTEGRKAKEDILNAAVALKLAMNLYDLEKEDKSDASPAKDES